MFSFAWEDLSPSREGFHGRFLGLAWCGGVVVSTTDQVRLRGNEEHLMVSGVMRVKRRRWKGEKRATVSSAGPPRYRCDPHGCTLRTECVSNFGYPFAMNRVSSRVCFCRVGRRYSDYAPFTRTANTQHQNAYTPRFASSKSKPTRAPPLLNTILS